jgi:hypothetical protein
MQQATAASGFSQALETSKSWAGIVAEAAYGQKFEPQACAESLRICRI